MIAAAYTAEWFREISISALARLIVIHEGREMEPAREIAAKLLLAAEHEAIERERKLRQIAREITREAGFEEPEERRP